ncbi:unnamed protein product [Echinostoma caproni]|uniref:BZIP domain-containing protein n=1 Tax=Echinostoma caproni TaxID=27848 RepID=A0A183AV39_9TREM|nr:unnamed protein product [Echinostoma caproni]
MGSEARLLSAANPPLSGSFECEFLRCTTHRWLGSRAYKLNTPLNKSAVLRQAIERIKELEEKNKRLQAEVLMLRRLHAVHVAKSDSNSSPESGISLDPSPVSSNYTGLEFGHQSSPSVGESCTGSLYNLNGTIPTAPSTASPNIGQMDIKDPMCPTPWSFTMSSPDKSDSTGLCTVNSCAPLDSLLDDYTYDRVYPSGSDEQSLVSRDVSTIHSTGSMIDAGDHGYAVVGPGFVPVMNASFESTAKVNGNRGKRFGCVDDCGPTKIRRQLVPSSVHNGNQVFVVGPDAAQAQHGVPQLHNSVTDQFHPTGARNETLPGVHRVLSQVPNQIGPNVLVCRSGTCKGEDAHERVVSGSAGGGFHDLAARTTLCVSALCLVALDPSVLTASGGSDSQGTTGTGTARRLLTISSSSWTSSFSSWMNCVLYLLQWVVALFLCFWAWKRGAAGRPSRRWRRSVNSVHDLPTARAHWVKANMAMNQSAITTSVKNLHQCLADLAQPLPPLSMKQGFRNALAGWFGLSLSVANLVLIRVPCRLCQLALTRLTARWFAAKPPAAIPSPGSEVASLTVPVVRSRLLELYLLGE